MKHVMLSRGWSFGTNPFPAFRSEMSYGRNQNDREFIGINGVTPNAEGILPDNAFKVIKTKEGAILIVAGEDNSPRCLLFAGSAGGFRGGVSIFQEATTGKVLKECSAGNACDSGIEVAVILDVNQSVGFYSTGRRTDEVIVHTWNGSVIETKTWEKQDWDRRNDPARSEDNVSWVPGNFRIVQLHGNDVSNGVTLENGELTRSTFDDVGILAHGFGIPTEGSHELSVVRFGRDMHNELVIAPAKDGEGVAQDRIAALVHEYSPGCGAKRWPSFHIDWDNAGQVEKLSSAYRGKGSGSDTYTLVIVPSDWAENIGGQFINERDFGGQTLSYKPGQTGKKESNLPNELLIAFQGDESRVRAFMDKVVALPSNRLDAHIIQVCGRARVKSHLEEVSGDPEFFMGADPNRVARYVSEVHFSQEGGVREVPQRSGGSSLGSIGDAFAKLGL